MAALSDLLVKMDMDSASFRSELNRAGTELGKFGEQVAKAGELVKHALEIEVIKESAMRLFEFVKAGAEAADQLDKLSQRAGIGVEDLQRLSYAARVSDVSNEELTKGLDKLSKSMAAGATGTGAQAEAFEKMGIKVLDGNGKLRATSDVLADVATRFKSYEDGAAKSALAQVLFGKSGAELIPFLNQGAEGLKSLGDEAERFGTILDENTIKQAAQFDEDLKRLAAGSSGLKQVLAAEMAPTLDVIAKQMLASSTEGGKLRQVIDGVASIFKVVAVAGTGVAGIFEYVGKTIGGAAAVMSALLSGNFAEAARINRTAGNDIVNSLKDSFKGMRDIWNAEAGPVAAAADSATTKINAPLLNMAVKVASNGKKARDEAQKAFDSIVAVYAKFQSDLATFGMSDEGKVQYRVDQGDLAAQFQKAGALADGYREKILAAAHAQQVQREAVDDLNKALQHEEDVRKEGLKIYDQTRTPLENYVKQIQNLQSLLAEGSVNQDTFNRAIAQAEQGFESASKAAKDSTDTMSEYAKQAARNMQSAFADFLFDPFKQGLSGLLTSFGQTLQRMAAQALASRIFDAIGSWGSSNSGGGGIVGAIASIAGTAFSKKASGGLVFPGSPYMVGEQGPEMFMPSTAGVIMPNGSGSGGGVVIHNAITVMAPEGRLSRETQAQLLSKVSAASASASRRNG